MKLAAAQAAREKLQGQLDKAQESNGSLHKQLADAHGKVDYASWQKPTKFCPCLAIIAICESRCGDADAQRPQADADGSACGFHEDTQCSRQNPNTFKLNNNQWHKQVLGC